MFKSELCHDTHSYLSQAVIATAVALSISLAAAAGTTWQAHVSMGGNPAFCGNPELFCCSISMAISADKRFAPFPRIARDLIPATDNGSLPTFLHDRHSCTTTLASEYRDAFGSRPLWQPSATPHFVMSSTRTCFHPAKTSLPVCSAARFLPLRAMSVLRPHHALYCHDLNSSPVWSEQHQHSETAWRQPNAASHFFN